ncbi:hypothetical protein M7I_0625 [Glarea lozoyensis 74030]|uniref:Involucrin repeat protein n=1 Tax=Glarea lozoyensis (strain ATCC 74030 / MF5533) TaxID=1104152 RepID=H0EDH6_GLAL7|nr:hypothetical protein M7I_0625 [Glarea lozoyensis 74030]
MASGSEPLMTGRPGPAPLQHPQPYTPVSQSIYEPSDPTVPDNAGILKKSGSSSGKGSSLAQAALVGVAVAAGGAAIASRYDDRKENRRDDDRDEGSRISSRRRDEERERERDREREEASRVSSRRKEEARDVSSQISSRRKDGDRDSSSRVELKRRDSDKRDSKDDRRKDKRDSPDRDDRKDKRRDKDRKKDGSRYSDEERREKKREKRREDVRDDRDDRKERRRDKDGRGERSEVATRPEAGMDDRRTKSEAAITTVSKIDPFMFQVADNAFPTPLNEYTESHGRHDSIPQVVTVERVPDFSRDYSEYDDRDKGYRGSVNDHGLHDAEAAYREAQHSTAPIAATAIGAAAAIVASEAYRERSEKRRNERRSAQPSDYSDREYETRGREPAKEHDPIQEEADRAYREIVMARKIASEVIRSRSASPNGSVVDKYRHEDEPEQPQISTPPQMDHPKIKGPYDAPNADFNPDHHFDDPRDLRTFRPETPILYGGYKDPTALEPRPLLNLVRPTPVPSPLPEKQKAKEESSRSEKTRSQPTSSKPSRSESSRSDPTRSESGRPDAARSEPPRSSKSRDRAEKIRTASSEVGRSNGGMDSPTSSTISKGVTWGENETKHFDVESPSDVREEYISSSDVPAYEKSPQPKSRPESKSDSKPSKGWGAIAAALVGAGAGAAIASSGDSSDSKKTERATSPPKAYEYRGVMVEPESPDSKGRRRSPPSPGPKPASPSSHMPGAFEEDLEFTANVAAGLKDAGFDSDIVIEDPEFRKRSSPPGSNERIYQAPYSETVSDLGYKPAPSGVSGAGYVIGEVETPPTQDWRSVSPEGDEEFPVKLSKKEQKKRDKAKRQSADVTPLVEETPTPKEPEQDFYFNEPKLSKKEQKKRDEAKRQSADVSPPLEQTPTSKEPEQDFYFNDPKLSKKEQKKREKEAKRQSSLAEDITPTPELVVAREVFEEPEAYFETPKKKKKSKRDSAAYNDDADVASPTASSAGRRVSVPIDAFADLQNDGDDWTDSKKSKSKSKRDSERFDSPSRSVATSETSERSTSKRKDKSRSYDDYERDPAEISLPPVTPSEASQDRDYDESRSSRKSRDSGVYDSRDRSVVSEAASRYDDEPRRKKKSSRSSTRDRDDFDDTRSVVSVASAPAGDDDRKNKKKEKEKKGGGFFGLFGSKSESGAREESPKGSKDDFDDVKSKKKKKRNSMPDSSSLYGDLGSQSVGDLSRSASNGHGSSRYDDDDARSDGEKKKSRSRANSSSSKRDSFLGNPGTLGARAGIVTAGTALALQHSQSNADDAYEEALHRDRPDIIGRDVGFDPDIVERHFRPSIDPQYGDLLPLPPSEPPTPGSEYFDELPGLPESRPDTPEDERLMREKLKNASRKLLYETPVKSPSHSAVPINFRMGKGKNSAPSSPGLPRASPFGSPATPSTETFGFSRNSRNRPTSWESAREYRPLLLPESVRRDSNFKVAEEEEQENLPALPPSETSSHHEDSSSGLDEFHDFPAEPQQQLSIDTSYEHTGLLDSQQSTPKAKFVFDKDEKEGGRDVVAGVLAGAAVVGGVAYMVGKGRDEGEREPSPIEPMSKDRSSFLLQSSPMGRGELSESTSKEAIEFEAVPDVPTQLPEDEFFTSKAKKEKKKGKLSRSATEEEVSLLQTTEENLEASRDLEASAQIADAPEDEFAPPKSKKDKKKGKLSRSSTQDDLSLSQSTVEVPETSAEVVNTQEDDFSAPKSKKGKKKDKKKGKSLPAWETEEVDTSTPSEEPTVADTSRDLEDISIAPETTEPVDDFFTPSKKDKKKNKKQKSQSAWEPEPEKDVVEFAPEASVHTSGEAVDNTSIPTVPHNLDEPSMPSNLEMKNETGVDLVQSDSKSEAVADASLPMMDREITGPERVSEAAAPETETARDLAIPLESEATDESFSVKSKKDKKKDKKGKAKMSWTDEPEADSAAEPLQTPDVARAMTDDLSTPKESEVEADDGFSVKSKKDKKKDKKGKAKMSWADEREVVSETLQDTQGVRDDFSTPAEPEPEAADDSFSVKPKKDKKKDKKGKSKMSWVDEPEPELSLSEALPALEEVPDVPDISTSVEHQQTTSDVLPETETSREVTGDFSTYAEPEPEAIDDSFSLKSKKDKKKDKKKAKYTDAPSEPMTEVEPEFTSEAPVIMPAAEEADDFSTPKSKKDKKKDKKKGKLTETFEPEPVPEITSEERKPDFDPDSTQDSFHDFPPEENFELANEDFAVPNMDEIANREVSPADFVSEEPTVPDEFTFQESKKGKKKKGKGASQFDVAEETISTPPPQDFEDIYESKTPGSKKGKKKGKKSWEAKPEPAFTSASDTPEVVLLAESEGQDDALTSDPIEDYTTPISLKKKKGKKSQGFETESEMATTPSDHFADAERAMVEDQDTFNDFATPTSKKGKKKGKKNQTFEAEPEMVLTPSSELPDTESSMAETQDPSRAVDTFDDFATPISKKGKKKGKKSQTWDADEYPSTPQDLATPENFSSKPTPMVGPGGWIETPATASTSARDESFSKAGKDSQDKDYFSSAILPGAAAVVAGAALLGTHESESKTPGEDSERATPDGLAAGYKDDQLSLAKQLQEEFNSKKSKKDKKKRQSLPATPDPEADRSRSFENIEDNVPRARSLSMSPAAEGDKPKSVYSEEQLELARQMKADFEKGSSKKLKKDKKKQQQDDWNDEFPAETPEGGQSQPILDEAPQTEMQTNTPKGDGLAAGYKEDQLELARQLKAEFEKGSGKKSKKDKKKKQDNLAWDDAAPEPLAEESMPRDMDAVEDVTTPDPTADAAKGDGLSAGYQEDQLSLARQLQAEFGKKSSKKNKKGRSTSQSPHTPQTPQTLQDAEPAADYFGEPPSNELHAAEEITPLESTRQISDVAPDGLAAGYKEDQLELARQLKEEFGSGSSKKSKKEKKGKKRGNFDDESFPASLAAEGQDPLDQDKSLDAETPEVVEGKEEFAFTTSKKGKKDKKGKKRDGSEPPSTPGTPAEPAEPTLDEPAPVDNEEDFGFTTSKKGKIDKKGKKRDTSEPLSAPETPAEERGLDLEEPTPIADNDQFAFTSAKKGKKDKKGKKRDSIALSTPSSPTNQSPSIEIQDPLESNAPTELEKEEDKAQDLAAEPEDEFTFAQKSSKNDKKGKKRQSLLMSTIDDNEPLEENRATQDSDAITLDNPTVNEPSTIDSSPAPDAADDDFANFSTKKSKKDKKGKKRNSSVPPVEIDESTTADKEPEQDQSTTAALEQDIDTESPAPADDDFAFTTKKGKKDKKKRQSLAFAEDLPAATPVEDNSSSAPQSAEKTTEPQDDFSFSSKKSKKDKKKRGSLLRHSSTYDDFVDEPGTTTDSAIDTPDNMEPAATQDPQLDETSARGVSQVEATLPDTDHPAFEPPAIIHDAIELKAPTALEPVVNSEDVFTSSKLPENNTELAQPDADHTLRTLAPLDPPSIANSDLIIPTEDNVRDNATTEIPSSTTALNDEEPVEWGSLKPKKSKKDKKKKKDLPSDSGEASGISTPLDETQEAKQDSTGPLPPSDSALDANVPVDQPRDLDLNESTEKTEQDDWFSPSSKSSKKDKKKRKSGTSTPIEIAPDQVPVPEESIAEETGTPAIEPQEAEQSINVEDAVTPTAGEDTQEVAEEEWAPTSKKSKKDKKKNRKSGVSDLTGSPADVSQTLKDEPQASSSVPEEPIEASQRIETPASDPVEEEWGSFNTKKSKKDKKRKSGLSTPIEAEQDSEKAVVEPTLDVEQAAIETPVDPVDASSSVAVDQPVEEPVDAEWSGFSAKKSKKDKKRKSGLSTPVEAEYVSEKAIEEPSTAEQSSEPVEAESTAVDQPSEEPADPEWGSFSTKKSKKDKKRKSGMSTPIETETVSEKAIEDSSFDVEPSSGPIEEPADAEWGSFSEKKSKKDKKRKSGISTPIEGESNPEPTAPDSALSMEQSTPEPSSTILVQPLEERSLDLEDPAVEPSSETIEQPADTEWGGFSTKKSKKDKKRKSGISTPMEEATEATEAQDTPTSFDSATPQIETRAIEKEPVADERAGPGNKSEKDKKQKSGITTPIEEPTNTSEIKDSLDIAEPATSAFDVMTVEETPADDGWGVSTKKSKKDKKKQKSGISTPAEELVDAPLATEIPIEEETAAQSLQPSIETPVDDEWAVPGKKSKKDKKKNKSGISTPAEEAPEAAKNTDFSALPEQPPSTVETSALETPIEETPADNEWAVTGKKSKKDKKKSKSGISTPIEDPIQQDIIEQTSKSVEDPIITQETPDTAVDEWAMPSKKSKKDKKKNKSGIATPVEEQFQSIPEPAAETTYELLPQHGDFATREVVDEPADEWSLPSKKSKKDKKGKKSGVSTPIEEPFQIMDEPTTEAAAHGPPQSEESTSKEVVDQPVDEWSLPSKKSKKDKKHNKSGVSTPIEESADPVHEFNTLGVSQDLIEAEESAVDRELTKDEPDEWSLPSKKSKKDKKNKKSGLSTPAEAPIESFDDHSKDDVAPEQVQAEEQIVVDEAVNQEPTDEWSMPTKKSKKDKKNNKSGLSTPVEEASITAIPLTISDELAMDLDKHEHDKNADFVLTSEPEPYPVETTRNLEENTTESTQTQDIAAAGAAAAVIVGAAHLGSTTRDTGIEQKVEPVEEWGSFSTKKSKKDKKKKSGNATPAEEPINNPITTAAEETLDFEAAPKETEEEWGSFSLKKSKKDKKKKSGTATPTEQPVSDSINTPTEEALVSEPVQQETEEELGSVSKKSKKDKKGKGKQTLVTQGLENVQEPAATSPGITSPIEVFETPMEELPEPPLASRPQTEPDNLMETPIATPMEDFQTPFQTPFEEMVEPTLSKEIVQEPADELDSYTTSKKSKKDKKGKGKKNIFNDGPEELSEQSGAIPDTETFQTPAKEISEPVLRSDTTAVQEHVQLPDAFGNRETPESEGLGMKSGITVEDLQISSAPLPALESIAELVSDEALMAQEAPKEIEDEWGAVTVRKGKKDKKGKGNNKQTFETTDPPSGEQRPIMPAVEMVDEPTTFAETSKVVTDDILVEQKEEFGSYSLKKSKKDKKGKGKNKQAFDTIDSPTTDQQVITPPAEAIPEPLVVEEAPKTATEDVIPEQEEDFGSYALKKSKKDKKKRKSGISTPLEEDNVPVPELTRSTSESFGNDNLTSTPLYTEPEELEAAIPTQIETAKDISVEEPAEEFAFTSKKSKKDKKGKRGSRSDSINISPGTSTPAEAELSREIVPEKESTDRGLSFDAEPVMESAKPEDEFSFPGTLSRSSSKKDKRKRQPTDTPFFDDDGSSSKAPLTTWADEVEEAEVERVLPVIEEIDHDQSLSHIAKSTEPTPADDFARPNKKGKKGKKSKSIDNSRAPVTFDPSKRDSTKEESGTSGLVGAAAVGAAVVGGAALGSGFGWKSTEVKKEVDKEEKPERPAEPVRKLSKKEKRKQSIDKRTPTNDIFDHDALWEGADPKEFEEAAPMEADDHDDGFWSPPQQESFQTAETSFQEPNLSRGSTMGDVQDSFSGPSTMPMERPLSPPDDITFAGTLPDNTTSTSHSRELPDREQTQPTITSPTNTSRDLPDSLPVDRNPFRTSGRFARSGFSDLPVLEEETQLDPEYFPKPQFHTEEPNRDSGFVTGSPVPPQGAFADNKEHIRDSGVHLRDLSPAPPRTPISSSDAAISRLAWPVVDEESETVYLDKSPSHRSETPDKKNRKSHRGEEFYKPQEESNRGFEVYQTKEKSNRSNELYLPKNEQVKEFFTPPRAESVQRSIPHQEHPPSSLDLLPSQKAKEDKHTDLHRTSTIHGHHDDGHSVIDKLPSHRSTDEPPVEVHRSEYGPHHEESSTKRESKSPSIFADKRTTHSIAETPRKPVEESLVKKRLQKFETPEAQQLPRSRESSSVKDRVQRLQTPEIHTPSRSKEESYSELSHLRRPKAEQPQGVSDNTVAAGAALAGAAALGFAAARQLSQEKRPGSAASTRSVSNTGINRLRTPTRPDSVNSNRTSTPPLRRSDRKISGDLRSLSQRSQVDLAKEAELAALTSSAVKATVNTPTPLNPTANEGRVRAKDMADVYDGFGEGRMGSPRSPTRPHSMRRRQSMQVLDLESKVEQLAAENRMLAEAKAQAERSLLTSTGTASSLIEKDAEIDALKRTLDWLQTEVSRLTEVNDGLTSANLTLGNQQNERYNMLESQHAKTVRELQESRDAQSHMSSGMEGVVIAQIQSATQGKDQEIAQLRAELETAKRKIREMQAQILMSKTNDIDFLTVRDEDYFDNACQQLCQHVQQWVLRFSKFSDMRACRLTTAVHQWRATTLTLLSKRDAFVEQREQDTQAVVHAVMETLSEILPPPSHLEDQIEQQLKRVIKAAVDLSIEMRTQRAEYMMLPPLQPEYDANGDLASEVSFNAALMNERSGDTISNEELENNKAVVRIVLFPLVVKKGDDRGEGDEEIVVCPAQVLVAKPKKSVRMMSPGKNLSRASMQSSMPADYNDMVDEEE